MLLAEDRTEVDDEEYFQTLGEGDGDDNDDGDDDNDNDADENFRRKDVEKIGNIHVTGVNLSPDDNTLFVLVPRSEGKFR